MYKLEFQVVISAINKSEIVQEGKKGRENLTKEDTEKGVSEEMTCQHGSE